MSTQKGHKGKRNIQDTPVDLTKMQLAQEQLFALQEELSGIEETETEMEEIMNHFDALQGILGRRELNRQRLLCLWSHVLDRKFRFLRFNNLISQAWDWSESFSGSTTLHWRPASQLRIQFGHTWSMTM